MHTDLSLTKMARKIKAKAIESAYATGTVTREVANEMIAELTGFRMDFVSGDTEEEKYTGDPKKSAAHDAAYFDRRAEEAKKVEEKPVEPVKSNNPYLVMKLA